jgi:protocatechuate 3,4-dioxygenase beta subunit
VHHGLMHHGRMTDVAGTAADHAHDDFGGLRRDLPQLAPLLGRRRVLQLMLGSAGAVFLAACSSNSDSSLAESDTTDTPGVSVAAASADCQVIPEETAGPFPGDGSNGPNVLNQPAAQRSDIRSSFGTSTRTAEGVPLAVALTVTDSARGCVPMAGAAVYVWHCDRDGLYSLYSPGAESENYLRGVGVTDESGTVMFTSIFPGAYPGRWPHIHFEVYPDIATAVASGEPRAISQLAFPADACAVAYTQPGYEASMLAISSTSLEEDSVFADDGGRQQRATVAGTPADGFTAQLTVTV